MDNPTRQQMQVVLTGFVVARLLLQPEAERTAQVAAGVLRNMLQRINYTLSVFEFNAIIGDAISTAKAPPDDPTDE